MNYWKILVNYWKNSYQLLEDSYQLWTDSYELLEDPYQLLTVFARKRGFGGKNGLKKAMWGVLMLGCSWEYLLVKRSGEVDCYNNNLKMYNTKGLNMREESFLVVSHNNINLRVGCYYNFDSH